MNHRLLPLFFLLMSTAMSAAAQRTTQLLNTGWRFALGDASSMERDFTHGTEYFTYLCKAAATGQNKGPANPEFNDSAWKAVTLPHDWVVDLPYSSEASHSHGYKQVGWRWPTTSVGWYRRHVAVPKDWDGRHIVITFDGIFRNSQVFCNGYYLGGEPSGYATQSYDITDYLNYGGDNVITVRADASTEEGWYYEGAGIYRDVWLTTMPDEHIRDFYPSISRVGEGNVNAAGASYRVSATVDIANASDGSARLEIVDGNGNVVAKTEKTVGRDDKLVTLSTDVASPHQWSASTPYLYIARTTISGENSSSDCVEKKIGFRTITFDAKNGMMVNGKREKLRGFDVHLDHAGVGAGVPDSLWVYRIQKLKSLGGNAIRMSHNPGTPAMLRACDSLGVYVIDENRLMGSTTEYHRLLSNMIHRDMHHPSVILWSIGNEEWAIESGDRGERIARKMIGWCHDLDSTRLTTYGNSGGFGIVKYVDVHGYNYIIQNDVDNRHRQYPDWVVIGTEETSGCGSRGITATDEKRGVMQSINTSGKARPEGTMNVIERGWQFYRDNPWAAGVFYWTGFDYRGEPNPMKWPSTGSEFGILDYCGFPKDEAWYLKAAWTNDPVVHIFEVPGRSEIWAYTNCQSVELFVDGKSLGRKTAEKDSHTVWKLKQSLISKIRRSNDISITAKGYETVGGRRNVAESNTITYYNGQRGPKATKVMLTKSKQQLSGNTQDVMVVDMTLTDDHGVFASSSCDSIRVSVPEGIRILGWGNGDPGWKVKERPEIETFGGQTVTIPAFNGHAQVILTSNRQWSGEPECEILLYK